MEAKQLTDYVPFGDEWRKEVGKSSKPVIIEMYRSRCLKVKEMEAAQTDLLAALRFSYSVIESNGVFERSEELALEKIKAAIAKATT